MAKSGRGSRQKGAAYERLLAKQLSKLTGLPFARGLYQRWRGGKEVSDVECADLKDDIHIEAKRQKSGSIKGAMKQALGDVDGTNKMPIVFVKDDNKDCLVTMRQGDWEQLFCAWLREQGHIK